MPVSLIKNIESANEFIKKLLPGSILIGGIIIMLYFYSIGYFAYDISIGEGLYFVTIASTFGLIYMFFLYCMIGFGHAVLYPITLALKAIIKRPRYAFPKYYHWSDFFYIKFEPYFLLPAAFAALWIAGLIGLPQKKINYEVLPPPDFDGDNLHDTVE